MIRMPGESWTGELPELTAQERELAEALRRDVEYLARGIGPRNEYEAGSLDRTAAWIEGRLRALGLPVERHTFRCGDATRCNLIAEVRGGDGILVVGAHYDSVPGCPGANDNASGVAALLALAGSIAGRKPRHTVRFAAFANEEPPYFQSQQMGSLAYARDCRARGDAIAGMISLETIGYYSDRAGSQSYPWPLNLIYPDRGDFIGFVGNIASRDLVRRAIGSFRAHARFPSEGAALPSWMPGVGWSDHWSFWQAGYPAIMVTDTAPFRYPHYHRDTDTPERLDYERLARVVRGLASVILDLAGR